MMGDVADHSEWVNHRRATGFVFAGVVFALKAGLGIGGAICGAIVDSFGFVSNTVQTDIQRDSCDHFLCRSNCFVLLSYF